MNEAEAHREILDLERAALDRWIVGDPHGFVERCRGDVTYFDHLSKEKIRGVEALREHVVRYEGAVSVPGYRMENVDIRRAGGVAVLAYNWVTLSEDGAETSRWNASEVFVREGEEWLYAHLHWSTIDVE